MNERVRVKTTRRADESWHELILDHGANLGTGRGLVNLKENPKYPDGIYFDMISVFHPVKEDEDSDIVETGEEVPFTMKELSELLRKVVEIAKSKGKNKIYFHPLNSKIEEKILPLLNAKLEEGMEKFSLGEFKDNPKPMYSFPVSELEEYLQRR